MADGLSFAEALAAPKLGRNDRLTALDGAVKWYRFAKLLRRLAPDQVGRPPFPVLLMFRALLLQQLYDLSDAGLEEALNDRVSFRRFVGLGLEQDAPDHTTLCRFRNRLVESGLIERLFAEFDRQLEAAGLMVKQGTMIDATLVEAARRPPPWREPAGGEPAGNEPLGGDPEARFAKRAGRAGQHYGYKFHAGVDQGSGLIRALLTTPANVNETEVADALVRGDEAAIYADKAYDTRARRAALKARGIKDRIMHRANKHHPQLPARLARRNRLIAARRAPVETVFAVFKRHMGLRRVRYVGLAKAAVQLTLAALVFNMRRASVLLAT